VNECEPLPSMTLGAWVDTAASFAARSGNDGPRRVARGDRRAGGRAGTARGESAAAAEAAAMEAMTNARVEI